MTKLLAKLQNPFALVGQGFVLGGILFFAFQPVSSQAAAPEPLVAQASR